jgi:hypothetical protein
MEGDYDENTVDQAFFASSRAFNAGIVGILYGREEKQ